MAVEKSISSGSTPMLLLKLLSEKDMYGYQIRQELEKRTGGAAFCFQILQRTDADIVLVPVNSHSEQAPVLRPPVSIFLRTTSRNLPHIRLTIITIENINFGQSEIIILIDVKYHPKDFSHGWHQIVYRYYSSMTSNIILAPSLKLFWNIRHSVVI